MLTINDNSLRAKAEIASRIIDFLEAKVVNLSFDDILKYKQEFKKICYKQLQSLQHPLYTIKFKNGQQCLKNEIHSISLRDTSTRKDFIPLLFKEESA